MLGFDALASLPLASIPAVTGDITGTSATTNANDTSSASGALTISGTVAVTNANDACAATGLLSVVGTSDTTNADDVADAAGTVSGGEQPSGGYRWHGHETFEEWQRRIRKIDDEAREVEAQAEAELDKLQVQRADMLQARAERVGKLTAAQQKRAAWLDMQISLAIAKINAAKQAQADAAHAFDLAVQQDYQRKRRNANAIRAFLMMV